MQYAALSAVFALSRDVAGAISGCGDDAPGLRAVLRADLLSGLPRPGAVADRAHLDPRPRSMRRSAHHRDAEARRGRHPEQQGLWCALSVKAKLGDEAAVDPILQPPRPAAARGEGAVAENGAPVGGIEQRRGSALRSKRAQPLAAHRGAQVVRQDRALGGPRRRRPSAGRDGMRAWRSRRRRRSPAALAQRSSPPTVRKPRPSTGRPERANSGGALQRRSPRRPDQPATRDDL